MVVGVEGRPFAPEVVSTAAAVVAVPERTTPALAYSIRLLTPLPIQTAVHTRTQTYNSAYNRQSRARRRCHYHYHGMRARSCMCVWWFRYTVSAMAVPLRGREGAADWPRCVLFFSRALPPPTKRRWLARNRFYLFFDLPAWDTHLCHTCIPVGFSTSHDTFLLLFKWLYTTCMLPPTLCPVRRGQIKKYYAIVNYDFCQRPVYLYPYQHSVICHELLDSHAGDFPGNDFLVRRCRVSTSRSSIVMTRVYRHGSAAIYNN